MPKLVENNLALKGLIYGFASSIAGLNRLPGVSASGEVKLLFGTYSDREPSTKLMTPFERRHTNTPTHRYVSPSRRL
jgi:hypothetical protein